MENQRGISSLIGIAIVVSVAVVALLGIVGYFAYIQYSAPKEQPEQTACTLEVKVCPDGSSVSRTGPNCEFAECLEVPGQTAEWKIYTNDEYGFEIKYPQNFKTTADVNPAGYLNLNLGYNNTPYIGDIAIQVIRNNRNETAIQYFVREKNSAIQGFASKCQTCANMDVDIELYDCLANKADVMKIAGKDGFLCKDMPQKATFISPIYVFNNGYIYIFHDYTETNPSYKIYSEMISTFKFTK